MVKLLQIVSYLMLVLAGVAIFFAVPLHAKHDLLSEKNEILTEYIGKIAKTIESKDAEDAEAPEILKDNSEVTERELANPDTVNLLDGYDAKLETANLAKFNLDSKREQLAALYALDADGKPVIDPVTGKKATKGKGTMTELLDQVFKRAQEQQKHLDKTRSELTTMREGLATVADQYNKLKVASRTTKKNLKESQEQLAAANADKERAEEKVAALTKERKELKAEVDDAKDQLERANEEKLAAQEEVANVKKALAEMQEKFKGRKMPEKTAVAQEGATAVAQLTSGDKGKVIAANDDLKFCIIKFSPETIAEMFGADREKPLPQLELNVRRGKEQFVTRVKLRQAVPGKDFVIADILNDWQQTPVEKGDVVFF